MKLVQFVFASILALALILSVAIAIDKITDSANTSYQQAIASREQARAAAEWARTQELQAAAAASAALAPQRAMIAMVSLAIGAAISLLFFAGVGLAIVLRLFYMARLVHPDSKTRLYPVPFVKGEYRVLNEPGSQTLAAANAASGGVLRAAVARNVMEVLTRSRIDVSREITSDPVLPEEPVAISATLLPDRVSVYTAQRPQRPALMVGMAADGPIELSLENLGTGLVGGLPGRGKTNFLASLIVGLARGDANGRLVQVAVVDTKAVDFAGVPDDLALLWSPVAYDVDGGLRLILALQAETERRFHLMRAANARGLPAYNAMHIDDDSLPYIVACVDEWADWTGNSAFMQAAFAIGRKGRGAGVSLVLATQTPRADVIDPRLRSLAEWRLAFRMPTAVESRVLGIPGAETLPPGVRGRALFWNGTATEVQTYDANVAQGGFDRYLSRRPRLLAPRSNVPGVPGLANAPESYDLDTNGKEREEPGTSSASKRKWDEFLAAAISRGELASPNHLARLMAVEDGRPGAWENYKSLAWRFLHQE